MRKNAKDYLMANSKHSCGCKLRELLLGNELKHTTKLLMMIGTHTGLLLIF
jgi:hypothetical protein